MCNSSQMGSVNFTVTDEMKAIDLKNGGTMWT